MRGAVNMSGHSKWHNIQKTKGAADAKRAQAFTKIAREMIVAVKEGGGGDPRSNSRLATVIAKAKAANMPNDNINRAIKKATGANADNYELITFEGYGPHGIAIFVECTTDNTNRTVANVRAIFNKHNGSLGTNGSLEFIFNRMGVFTLDKSKLEWDLDELQLELIEGGADSYEDEDEIFIIYTDYKDFGVMSSLLEKLKIEVQKAELQRIAISETALELEQAKDILKIISYNAHYVKWGI